MDLANALLTKQRGSRSKACSVARIVCTTHLSGDHAHDSLQHIPVLLSNSGQWGWYTFTNNGVLKKSCSFVSTREVSAHVRVDYITQQCFYGLDHGE